MISAAVVAVVLIVIFTIRWLQERKQVAATEKLDSVLDVAEQPIRKDPGAGSNAGSAAGSNAGSAAKPPGFATSKDRAAAVLAAMAKQDTDGMSHAFRGSQLFDVGKLDDAIAEYRKGVADKTIEGVLCREGLGLALEAKASADKDPAARQKGFEEALVAFTAMQPDEAGPRRAYALYHQGRMQLLLGKRAEAKALFEKAKTANKDNDHEITDLVDKRLAVLGAS
jgi:tetratricopeptide (TPR) repeat protein